MGESFFEVGGKIAGGGGEEDGNGGLDIGKNDGAGRGGDLMEIDPEIGLSR